MKSAIASASVFEDLGFSPEQAENLRVRSELALMIRKRIEARQLTQTAAARAFGVTQPRLNDLLRGRIHLFRIDALVSMLAHAGISVSVVPLPRFTDDVLAGHSATEASHISREVTERSVLFEDFSRPVGATFLRTGYDHGTGDTLSTLAA